MFPQLRPQNRDRQRRRRNTFTVAAIVCLVLLALIAVVQVAHTHQGIDAADHCPLCIVMHSAAPVAVAGTLIALVQVAAALAPLEAREVTRNWHPQLFTRPPPSAR